MTLDDETFLAYQHCANQYQALLEQLRIMLDRRVGAFVTAGELEELLRFHRERKR